MSNSKKGYNFKKEIINRYTTDYIANQINQSGKNIYNIVSSSSSNCKKFNCSQHTYDINFPDVDKTFEEAHEEINQLFTDLHNKFTDLMGSKDYIRLVFFHDDFDRPVGYKFLSFDNFVNHDLRQTFQSVVQSYRNITFNRENSLRAHVIIAHTPSGGSGSFLAKNFSGQQELNKYCNRFIYPINNRDNRCLAKAIIMAIKLYSTEKCQKKLTKIQNNLLHQQAIKINKKLSISNKPCGIEDIRKYEIYFKEYQIMVFEGSSRYGEPIYLGPKNKKHIYISYTGSHYNVITSMKRFLRYGYYCHHCKIGYSNKGYHTCANICGMCHIHTCENDLSENSLSCKFCKKKCHSLLCKREHETKYCYIVNKCNICGNIKNSVKNNHVCLNEKWCKNCKMVVAIDHTCYILTDAERTKQKKKLRGLIFFDYETYQFENKHYACLVIAERMCLDCLNKNSCHDECSLFQFDNNHSFCNWLFDKKNKDYTAIAHNMQGFDGLFLMKYIKESLTSIDKMPEMIINGTKIITLSFRNIRVIDSFLFIPMALAKFAKTFNLKELKKGFMCHLFASPQNLAYVGPIPDKKYYGSQFFSNEKKKEFDTWYAEKSKFVFDYKKELVEYCISDVKLLKEGCLAFRQIIFDITKGVDCFKECVTLASLCHLIFRKDHMMPKSIGIIPILGFNPEQRSSMIALQWLKWLSYKQNIEIKHSRNDGELKLGVYRVDGYHEVSKTIYEFHGCHWHGCPRCFTTNAYNQTCQSSYGNLYKRHIKRIQDIKNNNQDHKIIEMWECDWKELIKNNTDLSEFLKYKCNYSEPLEPRDALFGGRTNALKMYHKVCDGEKIKYVDFRSLYPDRQKYGKYPVGQPTIITEGFDEISKYFGLIKCRVLAPKGLYLPVLPATINKKLFFTLCETCALSNIIKCNHSDKMRSFSGTWTSFEIQKAIEKGYKIIMIYEIWHWEETVEYDFETKSQGLFTSYVDTFMKYKEEASGWPSHVNTPEERQQYIDNFYEKEGIKLDENNIKKNPGMRSVMKLMLNSLWGKFGMKTNKTQVKFINNKREWYEMLHNKEYDIHDINMDIPNTLTVYYSINTKCYDGDNTNNNINVAIAAFVTSQARLKLLDVMEKLEERILYHDTGKNFFFNL